MIGGPVAGVDVDAGESSARSSSKSCPTEDDEGRDAETAAVVKEVVELCSSASVDMSLRALAA